MLSMLRKRLAAWEREAGVDRRRLVSWVEGLVRLEDGRRFSFEGHEYLRGLYDDEAARIVVRKAAQLGVTTWSLLKSFHLCAYVRGVSGGVYFFPTVKDVRDFSRGRVGPLAEANPQLLSALGNVDSIEQKRIGNAFLHFRGLRTAIAVKSVPADFLVFDEVDEAPPDKVELARKRMAHSDFGIEIALGNPTLPDYGISAEFEASDRRYYHTKCPGCGQWVSPDLEFPRRFDEEVRIFREQDGQVYLVCPRCGSELDLSVGEWVPERQNSDLAHGYAMSHLLSSKVPPARILEEYRTTRYPDIFWNTTLGRPYADAASKLTRDQVLALCGSDPLLEKSETSCTMGVDVGKRCHVVVSRRADRGGATRQIVHLGIHAEWSEVRDLMTRFKVQRCVIDALPELHAARAFVACYPRRAFACYFKESVRGGASWDEEKREVAVNRVEALDLSADAVLKRKLVLPRRQPLVELFAAQCTVDAKRLETNEETGEQRYAYVKTRPPVRPGENEEYRENHLRLALTYDCLAWADEPSPPRSRIIGWNGPRRRYSCISGGYPW